MCISETWIYFRNICICSCHLYLHFTSFLNRNQRWSLSLCLSNTLHLPIDTALESLQFLHCTSSLVTQLLHWLQKPLLFNTEDNSLEAKHAICVTPISATPRRDSIADLSLNVLLFFLVLVLDQLNTKALWVLFILKSLFAGWWHHYSTSRLDQNY